MHAFDAKGEVDDSRFGDRRRGDETPYTPQRHSAERSGQ
jgi:hypothetical protein